MISIDDVTFKYKRKDDLFSHFSLNIEKGKIYGLLGKNGIGKSTLLYLMSGLLRPSDGRVIFKDKVVSRRLPETLSDIFVVPEEFDLPSISLAQYVKVNSPFYPNFNEEQMHRYLECFDMVQDIHLGRLSMGQKKKVFMSFALATNTSLLLMDEPTNGLDIQGKSQFRKFMALGMTEDKTIIISTHQVHDVDKMLEHIIILDDNRVIINQSVSNITNKVAFVAGSGKIDMADILYTQPTVSGNSIMMRNVNGEETQLNLELFYNALLTNKDAVSGLFNEKNENYEK